MKSHKWRAIIGMDCEMCQIEKGLVEGQKALESSHAV